MVNGVASHSSIYDLALAYDIAFDFRDLPAECDALTLICQSANGRAPASFMDLACGPGYHCIEFARRGVRSFAVDLNPAMLEFAKSKSESLATSVEFVHADMRGFKLPEPVDLAFCAMGSFHHLLSNHDIIAHLRSGAENLNAEGSYIIEADHPRDVFRISQSLITDWEASRGRIKVRTRWGQPDDVFDPITQIAQVLVRIELDRGEGDVPEQHECVVPYRHLTHQEFLLAVEASHCFAPVAWLGSINLANPMTNERESQRMVAVLRKLA